MIEKIHQMNIYEKFKTNKHNFCRYYYKNFMRKKYLIFIFIVLTNLFPIRIYSQNKIDKSKNELKSSSSSSSNNTSSSKSSSNSGVGNSFFTELFLDFFSFVTIGSYKSEDHLHYELTPYPMFKEGYGNFYDASKDSIPKKIFRIDLEGQFLYNNKQLFGNHIELKVRPFQYFHLQTDVFQIYEIQKIENTSDRLSLYYFNLGYDRIRMENFNFGWTLGASYIGDDVRNGGFSYGVNAEYFLNKNISFTANAKWSTINQFPVNSFDFEGKFHKKNYFGSLGFRHLKIATPTYNFVSLGVGISL
jgi:hypothetical protein